MEIRTARPGDREPAFALMERSLRPLGSVTRVRDDYPVALHERGDGSLLVAVEGGKVVSCLCGLVRPLVTSLGAVRVAGVGSVATVPELRGHGLSRRLQEELLGRLRRDEVALAVLWTERPELYARRGFRAAGCELHVDLARWRPASAEQPSGRIRAYAPEDTAEIERLYAAHTYRTLRAPGDGALLYGMPGTLGTVLEGEGGRLRAYVFCGKGLDFPGYVLEWGGDPADVATLLAQVRERGSARRLLAPAGAEVMAELLAGQGADVFALPSGMWAVLRPDLLTAAAETQGVPAPAGESAADPLAWLGGVGPDGEPRPGPLRAAVWGFDSV